KSRGGLFVSGTQRAAICRRPRSSPRARLDSAFPGISRESGALRLGNRQRARMGHPGISGVPESHFSFCECARVFRRNRASGSGRLGRSSCQSRFRPLAVGSRVERNRSRPAASALLSSSRTRSEAFAPRAARGSRGSPAAALAGRTSGERSEFARVFARGRAHSLPRCRPCRRGNLAMAAPRTRRPGHCFRLRPPGNAFGLALTIFGVPRLTRRCNYALPENGLRPFSRFFLLQLPGKRGRKNRSRKKKAKFVELPRSPTTPRKSARKSPPSKNFDSLFRIAALLCIF